MWRPTASIKTIQSRAKILAKIRDFFFQRGVLEVETPLFGYSTIPDPNIHSFVAETKFYGDLYLQTSPEFAMKRLLAAGSGSIYQICKAFRDEEKGEYHNAEFTILEWYRVGFDYHMLMDEMDQFFCAILGLEKAERFTYQEVFKKHLNIDPLKSSIAALVAIAKQKEMNIIPDLDHDGWLNLLMSEFIEPFLGKGRPTFIYNYPISQAALAKADKDNPKVAERFEVYIDGIELANGFHELSDATEQRNRFLQDLAKRERYGLPAIPLDEKFLAALEHGLPNCAGVALGIDRLLMLLEKADSISSVISFVE